MKCILEFNLPEESSEYKDAMEGTVSKIALNRICQELFRPARKHGYPDLELQKLLDKSEDVQQFVSNLEEEFWKILREEGVDL